MSGAVGNLGNPDGRTFYGWWIVAASIVVLFASSGIGFYCHGVILDPLQERYGWSKGIVSSAITFYFAITAITGAFFGPRIDRFGPRPFLIGGALLFSFSYYLLVHIEYIWQLYVVYFLMSIGWCGTSLLPVNTLIANWFVQKRGLAMSVTMTGLSLGGMVLVPLASYLVINHGFESAVLTLAVVNSALIIPFTFFFIKAHPEELSQLPDGERAAEPTDSQPRTPTIDARQIRHWTRRQAVKTRAFWAIVVSFSLALGVQMAYLVHQVSFLSTYLGKMGAASAVSITAGASIAGRLVLGTFVDRFDYRYVAMACILTEGLAVLTLAISQHVVLLYVCTFFFGLTMGSLLMMLPLLTGECFGMVSFGLVSGLIGIFSQSVSAIGPTVAGLIFDTAGSYQLAFLYFSVACLIAIVIVFFARPPE